MKITTEQTIQKFINKHNNLYDYSLVNYTTAKTKCKVICKMHGVFEITPNNHLSGYGCPKCSNHGFSDSEKLSMFLINASNIHGTKYDYSKITTNTINSPKLHIICPIHGSFYITKVNHLTGKCGCAPCGINSASKTRQLPPSEFISKSKITHGDQYNYDKTQYIGAHKKVTITCPKHGDFSVTPANHWSNGVGCPTCQHSNPTKGEAKVAKWLTENNIHFLMQKSFPNLHYKSLRGRLKYDFFLPKYNMLIEFDGEQHFTPITFSKSRTPEEQFKITQDCDKLKTEYAKNNGYKLLRIRYDQDVIYSLASSILATGPDNLNITSNSESPSHNHVSNEVPPLME